MDRNLAYPVYNRVSRAISLWRETHQPNAKQFLQENPEVTSSRTLVIDLAYEEFCLREESGERIDTAEFCRRFPTVQRSLERMLDVHRMLASKSLGLNATTPVAWPEVGNHWLDWHLVEPLGRGAFSHVFLAREEALGNREVVVKCCVSGPQEAFILGRLSHSNIVPIHSVRHDQTTGLTAICMPFLGRVTLAEVIDRIAADPSLREGAIDLAWMAQREASSRADKTRQRTNLKLSYSETVVSAIERVASGLAAAHGRGIVHGDIKPSNILLSFAGDPMLVDFNLSTEADLRGGRVGGTPPYMAPECLDYLLAAGERAAEAPVADPRSDVFSLGVVLLELLSGAVPFAADITAKETRAREDDWLKLIKRPMGCRGSTDNELQRILKRCLAFDLTLRYAAADDLARDLAAYLASRDRQRRRRRSLLAITALGVTACFIVGGATLIPKSQATAPEKSDLREEVERLSRPEALLEKALRTRDSADFLDAAQKLARAYRDRPDASLAAWVGYCFAEGESLDSGKRFLDLALLEHANSAILWNDLGYCNTSLLHREEAEIQFKRAIQIDPQLQAAHHNLALLLLRRAMNNGQPLPAEAWDEFQLASDIGQESARLHMDMATALAYAKTRGQQIDADIMTHIRKAASSDAMRRSMEQSRLLRDFNVKGLPRELESPGDAKMPSESALLLPPPFLLPTLEPRPAG